MAMKEKEVFTKNYGRFCDILKNEDSLLNKFVEKKIISFDQAVVLRGAPITRKGQDFLVNISGPLDGGQTKGFYIMLEIMKVHGRINTQDFVADIEQQLQDRVDVVRRMQDRVDMERQMQDRADMEQQMQNHTAIKQRDHTGAVAMERNNQQVVKDDKVDYEPAISANDKAQVVNESDSDGEPRFCSEDLEDMRKVKEIKLQYDQLDRKQKNAMAKARAMIVVVNENELMATLCYLQPPDGFDAVLQVHRAIYVGPSKRTGILRIGKFGICPVTVIKVNAGCGQDAVHHADKKTFPNVKLIAGVGVAAGIRKNSVRLGDVVISSQIYDCNISKMKDGEIIPRGVIKEASKYVDQVLQTHAGWRHRCTKVGSRYSQIQRGCILSKPELINDPVWMEKLLKSCRAEAKGFEMEGFGIMDSPIDCIIIKGVCDYASKKTDDWQPTAALAANDYLYHHFKENDLGVLDEKSSIDLQKWFLCAVIVGFVAYLVYDKLFK